MQRRPLITPLDIVSRGYSWQQCPGILINGLDIDQACERLDIYHHDAGLLPAKPDSTA